jgi:hypothetical protein
VFELLDKRTRALLDATKTLDFRDVAETVTNVRSLGHFVADRFSLFRQQGTSRNILSDDPWLEDLGKLIDKHFQAGRDLGGAHLPRINVNVGSDDKEQDLTNTTMSLARLRLILETLGNTSYLKR